MKGVKLKSNNGGRRPFKQRDEFSAIVVNHRIQDKSIRLIDSEGNNKGVVDTKLALNQAQDQGLDLVVISDKSSPPVCKILDFSKYKYELKEIQLRPVTDDNDINVKIKKINEFIADGDKVKIVVKFRGRELAFKDQGFSMLNNIIELADNAKFESKPNFNGRNLIVILVKNS
jgi:translation initiation factor IF-3